MSSKQSTVDYIVEQIGTPGTITAKKMFGEYALYADNKVVALVCNDQLFVKMTAVGKEYLGQYSEASPYPGAKPCFLILGDKWEDREWMTELFAIAAKNLPTPRKKTPNRKTDRSK